MEDLKAAGEEPEPSEGESIEEGEQDNDSLLESPAQLIRASKKPSMFGLKLSNTHASHFPWQMTNASSMQCQYSITGLLGLVTSAMSITIVDLFNYCKLF